MKRVYISSLLLLLSYFAFSQHSHRAYLKLADSLYIHHHYESAAFYYERALKKAAQPDSIMLQIAKCYSKTNKVTEADQWFNKSKEHHAQFSHEDIYQHVGVLMMLEKYREAETILEELLTTDPNALYARQLLEDIIHVDKFYKDSLAYIVKPLSINTSVSEFAPVYYKGGIVFSSAKPRHFAKKKYHWDNSHFLNLFYSARIKDHEFQKPMLFDKELNTRFHDGPVAFYGGGEKMIINRNQSFKMADKKDSWTWHMTLFDGHHSKETNSWELNPLPFNQPYAFIHPAVTEDGNIVYFSSDKPGGYGGTDIYRIERTNGVWGTPFNLGPNINTPENEVFPYVTGNTLYFSSNGHAGLGGLDIFKSIQTINGFGPPVNMGYPVNSHVDDFSFITTKDGQSGYFSSARTGNDDLFSFQLQSEISMLARIFDGITRKPLAGATVRLISTVNDDITLTSDSAGHIQFNLPSEAAYVVIGEKNGKVGMISGTALSREDHQHIIHQMPAYGDTTRVPCIGNIRNESGAAQNAATVQVTDETTGEKIMHAPGQPLVSFLGEKGHSYRIEIRNNQGDTVTHKFTIDPDQLTTHTWNMILEETPATIHMAARIFREEDNGILGGADVRIITFAEPDMPLVADENGIVEFSLPENSAYIVVGSKDGLTGMHAGVAVPEMASPLIIHPVPARGDPLKPIPVVALVTNEAGEILHGAVATITDKATGETIPVETQDGVLRFFSEHGKQYNISIAHKGYLTTLEEINVTSDAPAIEKIAVVMEEEKSAVSSAYEMAVRVLKEDQSPLDGAQVKVISFAEPELEQVTSNEGITEFTLPDGSAYMVIATKDGYTGMHTGIAKKGMDKASVIHPIIATKEVSEQLPVLGLIVDETGTPVKELTVHVSENVSGENIPSKVENGILYFPGKKGNDYQIEVTAPAHETQIVSVRIEPTASIVTPLEINLLSARKKISVTSMVTNTRGEPIQDISATITDKATGETLPAEIRNGLLSFGGEQGRNYSLSVNHKDYNPVAEEIIIPIKATFVKDISIALEESAIKKLPVTLAIASKNGEQVSDIIVQVTDKVTNEKIDAAIKDGVITFKSEPAKQYTVSLEHPNYETLTEEINIPVNATSIEKIAVTLKKKPTPIPAYSMAVRVLKEDGKSPVPGAQVKIISFAEPELELTANEEGVADFTLPDGSAYIAIGSMGSYTGMHSGMVEKDAEKTHVIHPVLLKNDSARVAVAARITGEDGEALNEASVTVTENSSGKKVPSEFRSGILSFYADKGKEYSITAGLDGHGTSSQQISIPMKSNPIENISITLSEKTSPPIAYQMAVRVLKEDGKSPVPGAQVKIISFAEPELELTANEEGVADFTLPDGSAYIAVGSMGSYTGMHSGMVEKDAGKTHVIHPVLLKNDSARVAVAARITGEDGEALNEASVTVTENSSGKKVPSEFISGILSFYADKGKEYSITAGLDGHGTSSQQISIPLESGAVKNIAIALPEKTLQPLSYKMAVRVFKERNKSSLDGAVVKVISFAEPDMELIADKKGITEFMLPEGTAYIVIASKDDYTGMHTGIVEQGMSKDFIIHPVPASKERKNELPVLAMVIDDTGEPVGDAFVEVTDNGSGEKVNAKIENGILYFYGKKGASYKVEVRAQGYENQERNIEVDPSASSLQPLEINLGSNKKTPASLALPASSKLIVLKNGTETDKYYVIAEDTHFEIVEKNGSLYLQNTQETRLIGQGVLAEVKHDPAAFISALSLSSNEVITLQNIYFDYNKATLDDGDKQELEKVRNVIQTYPFLQLTIRAHADDRGAATYNLNLSKKRARTIEDYLVKQGVTSARLVAEAYGESIPVVPCSQPGCTEEDHQKNRRAEFILSSATLKETTPVVPDVSEVKPVPAIAPASKSKPKAKSDPDKFGQMMKKYGDRQLEGLIFKVSVGAYRYNPDLTFSELTDLGTIEKQLAGGINYYYLGDFPSFRVAEDLRQQVIARGITDAYISIFYNEEKISFSKFISLTD